MFLEFPHKPLPVGLTKRVTHDVPVSINISCCYVFFVWNPLIWWFKTVITCHCICAKICTKIICSIIILPIDSSYSVWKSTVISSWFSVWVQVEGALNPTALTDQMRFWLISSVSAVGCRWLYRRGTEPNSTDRPDEILIDQFCQCCWVQVALQKGHWTQQHWENWSIRISSGLSSRSSFS